MNYNKPPPYERANWDRLNEGQRRYAMEQYNLALVRRGQRFDDTHLREPGVQDDTTSLDDIELDSLGSPPENTPEERQQADNEQQEAENEHQDNEAGEAMESDAAQIPQQSPAKPTGTQQGGKRKQNNQGGAAKRKPMHSCSALPGTSGNTDGMTGAGGSEDNSRAIQHINRGLNVFKYNFEFTKKWKFLSFGVADNILEEPNGDTNRWVLTSSLVNIPWEYAFMYMSPAEFERLKAFNGVQIKHAKIKVFQYNPRVAFQTADTTSTTATLNQNKFTRVLLGARSNSALCCSDRDYNFDDTEFMKPISLDPETNQAYRNKLANRLYGVPNNSNLAAMQGSIPAYVTGHEVGLQRYLTFYAPQDVDIGFTPYDQFVDEYNSMDCIGQCVLETDYTFKYAYLRPNATVGSMTSTFDKVGNATATGTRLEILNFKKVPTDLTINPGPLESEEVRYLDSSAPDPPGQSFWDNFYHKFPMEQSGMIHELNMRTEAYGGQQSVHVGVRAVPKLSTNANLLQPDSWLDTQMYWTVECTLQVEASDPFGTSRGNAHSIPTSVQYIHGTQGGTPQRFLPFVQTNDITNRYGRMVAVTDNLDL